MKLSVARSGMMNRSFEVEEVEPETLSRARVVLLLAKASGKSIGQIILEDIQRAEHAEFWADPCWSEPDRTTN